MKYIDGMNGWAGWQWLFLVQGLPASLLGIVAYFYLQDKPEDARWLVAGREKARAADLEHDKGTLANRKHGRRQMCVIPRCTCSRWSISCCSARPTR